mgnify:CR=1 FL=1
MSLIAEFLNKLRKIRAEGGFLSQLTPLEKALGIGAVHTTAAVLDLLALKQKGIRPLELALSKPGVALAGIALGAIYFSIVEKIIESSEKD